MDVTSASAGRPPLAPSPACEQELALVQWDVDTDQWWWSPGMYRLYGHAPGSIRPSLNHLLGQQHPEDRERIHRAFEGIRRDGHPFVFEHRIVTGAVQLRNVILSAKADISAAGRPCVVSGTSLDVSGARRIHHAAKEETMDGLQSEVLRLSDVAQTRELVSQATGVLMERHKLPAGEALALLREASQAACRKLRDVSSELLYTGRLPGAPVDRGVPRSPRAAHRTPTRPVPGTTCEPEAPDSFARRPVPSAPTVPAARPAAWTPRG
jgi:hypothetical protein